MPFQDRIYASPWPLYCISYNEMKRNVYDLLRTDSGTVYPEKEFQDLLQVEVDKVNLFTNVKYEDIFRSLQSLALSTEVPVDVGTDLVKRKQYFSQLEKSIDLIAVEIVNLDKYVRVNCEGLIKLVTKFDAILRSSGANWFIARLGKEEFCNVNFQSLFILLSLTWTKYRQATAVAATSEGGTWRPPESFVRQTSKYWVKPENVPRLKACILKHLPYLIFGASISDQERYLDPTTVFAEDGGEETTPTSQMSETQLITSIYFDNTQKDIYRQRILRKEGARLVRFRWYGYNEGSPDQDIFIERKVHHESWFAEASSKDRFTVKQKDVFRFMKGQYDISSHFDTLEAEALKRKKDLKPVKSMRELAYEVDSFIKDNSLQPFIRTCYYRCAFQLATSNAVRISLDTQMSLINEYIPQNHPREPWCRVASDVLAEQDIVRFPYAILEVKLADAKNTPEWVDDMLSACGAIKVQKFSKFLHAMAFLHPDNINILPHWFSEFKGSEEDQTKAIESTSLSKADRLEKILISVDEMDDQTGAQQTTREEKLMRSIEPKSIYANERTFLHYCQKSTFLLSICIGLGYKLVAGEFVKTKWVEWIRIVLAVIGLVYLWSVYRMYQSRRDVLLRGTKQGRERLDVIGGPYMAGFIIFIGSLTSLVASTDILK